MLSLLKSSSLCSKLMPFEQARFESQPGQTLGTHSFALPSSKCAKLTSNKDPSNIYLEPEKQQFCSILNVCQIKVFITAFDKEVMFEAEKKALEKSLI